MKKINQGKYEVFTTKEDAIDKFMQMQGVCREKISGDNLIEFYCQKNGKIIDYEYIINYLRNYNGTILVISHDIDFLDQVTTQTLYVDKATHKMELYPGNYEKYMKIRNERLKTLERIHDKQEKEEEKLKKIIAKYIGGNEKKAKIAKDRQKKLARLEENKVVLEQKQKVANFKMKINQQSGVVPVKCENLKFGYTEDHILIDDLTFDLGRGEKFLIVGENGVGKSTLLKLIVGQLKPMLGEIVLNQKKKLLSFMLMHLILVVEHMVFKWQVRYFLIKMYAI